MILESARLRGRKNLTALPVFLTTSREVGARDSDSSKLFTGNSNVITFGFLTCLLLALPVVVKIINILMVDPNNAVDLTSTN